MIKQEEKIAQISVAGWGAALAILLTISEDSWLAKFLVEINKDNGGSAGFLHDVGDYVAIASAGLIFSSMFLFAEAKTKESWPATLAAISFMFLVLIMGVLMFEAFGLEPPTPRP